MCVRSILRELFAYILYESVMGGQQPIFSPSGGGGRDGSPPPFHTLYTSRKIGNACGAALICNGIHHPVHLPLANMPALYTQLLATPAKALEVDSFFFEIIILSTNVIRFEHAKSQKNVFL
jgi:hypothetical protein